MISGKIYLCMIVAILKKINVSIAKGIAKGIAKKQNAIVANAMQNELPVRVIPCSGNRKTGWVVATYAPLKTCSEDCVFLNNGCYGQSGFVRMKIAKIQKLQEKYTRKEIADIEAREIAKLPGVRPMRLHVTGDCDTITTAVTVAMECEMYTSKQGMPVWTYTHSWRHVNRSAWGSVSVLASCETVDDTRQAMEQGYAAALVSTNIPPSGIIQCPAQTKGVKCVDCRICFSGDKLLRNNKVLFFALHGSRRMAAAALATRRQMELKGVK